MLLDFFIRSISCNLAKVENLLGVDGRGLGLPKCRRNLLKAHKKLEKSDEIILKIVQICGQFVWERAFIVAFIRPF